MNRIVHHLLNMYLYEKLFSKQFLRILVLSRKSQKTYRTCTYERYLKFFVAMEVLPPTTLKKHVWSDLARSKLLLLKVL